MDPLAPTTSRVTGTSLGRRNHTHVSGLEPEARLALPTCLPGPGRRRAARGVSLLGKSTRVLGDSVLSVHAPWGSVGVGREALLACDPFPASRPRKDRKPKFNRGARHVRENEFLPSQLCPRFQAEASSCGHCHSFLQLSGPAKDKGWHVPTTFLSPPLPARPPVSSIPISESLLMWLLRLDWPLWSPICWSKPLPVSNILPRCPFPEATSPSAPTLSWLWGTAPGSQACLSPSLSTWPWPALGMWSLPLWTSFLIWKRMWLNPKCLLL